MSVDWAEHLYFYFLEIRIQFFKSVPYDMYVDICLLNSNIFRTEIGRRKLTLILLKLPKYVT